MKPHSKSAPEKVGGAKFSLPQTSDSEERQEVQALVSSLSRAESMAAPPENAIKREEIGEQLWASVLIRFEQGLSPSDVRLWRNPPAHVENSPEHLRLLRAFDDFVLTQFRYWGWVLFMSRGTLQRLAEWKKDNPRLLERLGKELALNSRVFRGEAEARYPISDKSFYEFKEGAAEEVRRLFRKLRTIFGPRRQRTTNSEIAEWVKAEIETQPLAFPWLYGNLPQLDAFLRNQDSDFASRLVTTRMQPKEFIYRWIAASTGYSLARVKQEISQVSPKSRSPRS